MVTLWRLGEEPGRGDRSRAITVAASSYKHVNIRILNPQVQDFAVLFHGNEARIDKT